MTKKDVISITVSAHVGTGKSVVISTIEKTFKSLGMKVKVNYSIDGEMIRPDHIEKKILNLIKDNVIIEIQEEQKPRLCYGN